MRHLTTRKTFPPLGGMCIIGKDKQGRRIIVPMANSMTKLRKKIDRRMKPTLFVPGNDFKKDKFSKYQRCNHKLAANARESYMELVNPILERAHEREKENKREALAAKIKKGHF